MSHVRFEAFRFFSIPTGGARAPAWAGAVLRQHHTREGGAAGVRGLRGRDFETGDTRRAELWFGFFALSPFGSKPMGSHFGVGAPPILVYFSGDWDVHWGHGLLTHGPWVPFLQPLTSNGSHLVCGGGGGEGCFAQDKP